MTDTLNVTASFDTLHCYDEGDGWGNAEPYLWTCFFKIDGDGFAVESGSGFIGTPTIVSSNGSHGNLGDTDVDAGDDVGVPEAIGTWHTKLKPIPVNDAGLRALIGDTLPGFIGVVVVAMEEDGWPNSLADSAYSAFVDAVRLGVVKVAAGFQKATAKPTKAEIDIAIAGVKDSASAAVRGAVLNAMSGWQIIWYGTFGDNDDTIGSASFVTDSDTLEQQQLDLTKRWSGDESGDGDWEIRGRMLGVPDIQCSLDHLFSGGAAADAGAMKRLRDFRDGPFRELPGLGAWWDEFRGFAPALAVAMAGDRELRATVAEVVRSGADALTHPEEPIESTLVAGLRTVVASIQGRTSRRGATVLRQAGVLLDRIEGRSTAEAVTVAAALKPVGRTPRVDRAEVAVLTRPWWRTRRTPRG
jgi:hypothetical protein